MKKKIFFSIAIFLPAFFLLFLELGIRLSLSIIDSDSQTLTYGYDLLRRYKINALKFQENKNTDTKAGSLRIVAVGGSTTKGYRCKPYDYASSYPDQLEFFLNQDEDLSQIYSAISVLNKGRYGGTSFWARKFIEESFQDTKNKPSIIIWSSVINDMGQYAIQSRLDHAKHMAQYGENLGLVRNLYNEAAVQAANETHFGDGDSLKIFINRLSKTFYELSMSYKLIFDYVSVYRSENLQKKSKKKEESFVLAINTSLKKSELKQAPKDFLMKRALSVGEFYRNNLKAAIEKCLEHSCLPVIVHIPMAKRYHRKYEKFQHSTMGIIRNIMKEEAQKYSVPFIDVAEVFESIDDDTELGFCDTGHKNILGNQYVGYIVYQKLKNILVKRQSSNKSDHLSSSENLHRISNKIKNSLFFDFQSEQQLYNALGKPQRRFPLTFFNWTDGSKYEVLANVYPSMGLAFSFYYMKDKHIVTIWGGGGETGVYRPERKGKITKTWASFSGKLFPFDLKSFSGSLGGFYGGMTKEKIFHMMKTRGYDLLAQNWIYDKYAKKEVSGSVDYKIYYYMDKLAYIEKTRVLTSGNDLKP